MEHGGGGGGGAAPTGCYKCGRPGHWSRDCPSNPISGSNTDLNNSKSTPYAFKTGGDPGTVKSTEKPKKLPRSRPKLTPEVLLSNDGLGYVLRHFPQAFKYHGRGHEVRDLGNLLGLYSEWHSHLLPYYSFDQFVHKVEQVGSTKRVKLCLKELQERVAHGGDPTKLHENPVQPDISNQEQEAIDVEDPSLFQDTNPLQNQNTDDFQDAMLHEIYEKATEEPSQTLHDDIATAADTSALKEAPSRALGNIGSSGSAETPVSEEQKTRIEANRLKALERAAARARSSQAA